MTAEPIYLDCNATTPIDPDVADVVQHYLTEAFYGNAGSRTHELGNEAKKVVELARRQVADVVNADAENVIFTSGATESNNLAILGLAYGPGASHKRHIITTAIEHKAVLEPVSELEKQGFGCTILPVDSSGKVSPESVLEAVRPDTLLLSCMHVNNETGVIQPIAEIAEALAEDGPYFHVDAAQGFGKDLAPLQSDRIDLMSISGHKIFGPKGIGALITRKRNGNRLPIQPLMFGGGQERNIRPGTLPVPLIAGLGKAAEIAVRDEGIRRERCVQLRSEILDALSPLNIQIHGTQADTLPHVINFSIPGVDSEAAMLAWKGLVQVSNGSACTSASYDPSHVLVAMGIDEDEIEGALRLSWSHLTPDFEWNKMAYAISNLL